MKRFWIALPVLCLVASGCIFSKKETFSDGTAAYMSQEVSDMGSAADFSNFTGTAKSAVHMPMKGDTCRITVTAVRRAWAYENGWWVREMDVAMSDGRGMNRIDSIQFSDAEGNAEQRPSWNTTSGWTHYRHTERVGFVNSHSLDFAMQVTLSKSTDTTGTWNGTVTGRLNGESISSTTVTNVVRNRAPGYWEFPSSGNIYMVRPLRTIDINYTGNGEATALITRNDGKTKTITIHVESGTEQE